MVLLKLEIKAELENLTGLAPQDPADFTYYFKIKCSHCGSITEKLSNVTASEVVEVPKSRGIANLVQKCKICERVGTIAFVEGKCKPYTLDDSECGNFVPIACFDCRGIEPTDFTPGNSHWSAEGLTGTKFRDVDLSEGEFAEYDDKAATSVGVLKLEHRFEAAK